MLQMSCFRGCSRAGNLNPNLFGTKSLAGWGVFVEELIRSAISQRQWPKLNAVPLVRSWSVFRGIASRELRQRNCFRRAAAPQESLQKSCCRGAASEELLQRSCFRRAASEELLQRSCFRGAALQELALPRKCHRPNRVPENLCFLGRGTRKLPEKRQRRPEKHIRAARKKHAGPEKYIRAGLKKTCARPEKNTGRPEKHIGWPEIHKMESHFEILFKIKRRPKNTS